MNLLEQYIPDYSGHIQSLKHDSTHATLEIVFYDRPEEFNAVIKLVFEGVSELNEVQLDEPDENCIELVIGLDEVHGGYCLHTDFREINFLASKVESFGINT
jgi:hypothetical protein